jgi:hypothetical protein
VWPPIDILDVRDQRAVPEHVVDTAVRARRRLRAARLWPAAHNARWEALHGDRPLCGDALRAQAAERLSRAGA